MKKISFIVLCVFASAILITNCVLIYQNSKIQMDFADTAQVHFSKLLSAVGAIQNLSNIILSNQDEQSSSFDDRISSSEFVLIDHNGEYTSLGLNFSFSKVDKDENISLVLHEIGSDSFQRIELSKIYGVYYKAELRLSPEKEYYYQFSFEKDGVVTSSREYRIPVYYYNPYTWNVIPQFVNYDTKKQTVTIEFRLDSISSKPYFKEFQINSARLVVYKNGMKLEEIPYNINSYGNQSWVNFEFEGSNIDDYDFYLQVEYSGGFEKRQKIDEPENPLWKEVLSHCYWFSKGR